MSGHAEGPEEAKARRPSRGNSDDGEDTGRQPPAVDSGEVTDSELRERGSRRAFLIEVNEILAARDAEAALEKIVTRLRERTRLTSVAVFLLESAEPTLRCVARSDSRGIDNLPNMDLNGGGLIPRVARVAEPVYVPDVLNDPRESCRGPTIKSQFGVPLCAGSTVLGVLHVESDRVDGIRAVTRKLIEQCGFQVAFAIERSDLARKLQASEERFRTIFEQAHLGVALFHLDGKLSVANLGLARMLGLEAADLHGKHYADLVHPEERRRCEENLRRTLEGKLPRVTVEIRLLRKSGEPLWCQMAFSLLRDAAGNPNFALAIVQDISDRKRSELEREELREQLLQSQKMEAIGTLAGGVAHDFNNVLGVILGFASLLRLRLSSQDPVYEPIKMIEQSAERAAGLTRQLLSFAQHGKHQPQAVVIQPILERVVRIATETFDRRIRVEAQFSSDAWFVKGDPGQLEQAFLNLCINARDSMPEGGTLTLDAAPVTLRQGEKLLPQQSPPGPYLQIVIKDTGSGIAPQVLERIFEPFFTTKEPGKGTGLGLAVVYGIVNNHGGFIRVASEVGRGSEFAVYLPSVSPHQASVESKTPEAVESGVGTVLVVDDEPMILAFVEEGLTSLGYRVVKAEDGARACEIYSQRATGIDFVLMDVVLPGMSGLDAARKLREINPGVKIILSSGYAGRGTEQEVLEAGVVDFIGKPYTVEMLSRVFSKARQEAARSAS